MAYKSKYKGAEIDARLEKMVNVTYAELVALRDEEKLIAGQMYRMTDYETYCGWADTECAGHPFDLVLTALDEKTLDEKCSAIWSERDVDGYFANSNLPAWDVRYCLDNDTNRFDWAVNAGAVLFVDLTMMEIGMVLALQDGTLEYDGTTYFKWVFNVMGMQAYILTDTDSPSVGELAKVYIEIDGEGFIAFSGPVTSFTVNEENGNGVIYRITDEKGNSVPYDFKNIKFARSLDGSDKYLYTFSIISEEGSVIDSSIFSTQVLSNIFSDLCFRNVFVGGYVSYNTLGYGCQNNTAGEEFGLNTFGIRCSNNIFGDYCSSNVLKSFCMYNTFGDDCQYNTIGESLIMSTFGNYFEGNTLGDMCEYFSIGYNGIGNTFGDHIDGCTAGDYFRYNTLGDYCRSNTFGDYCYSNTFGSDCCSNTFGDECGLNTFGDRCYSNTFGSNCEYNTFGDGCDYNTFGSNCEYNTFGDGCDYNKLFNEQTSALNNNVKNYNVTHLSNKNIPTESNRSYTTYVTVNKSGEMVEYTVDDIINK